MIRPHVATRFASFYTYTLLYFHWNLRSYWIQIQGITRLCETHFPWLTASFLIFFSFFFSTPLPL